MRKIKTVVIPGFKKLQPTLSIEDTSPANKIKPKAASLVGIKMVKNIKSMLPLPSMGLDSELLSEKLTMQSDRSDGKSYMSQRSTRSRKNRSGRPVNKSIKATASLVNRVYQNSGSFFDRMYFDEDITSWENIATNFVIELTNNNLVNFI